MPMCEDGDNIEWHRTWRTGDLFDPKDNPAAAGLDGHDVARASSDDGEV
jgi:hypothetical protein